MAGRPGWLAQEWSQPLDARLAGAVEVAEQQGRTVIAAGWDGAARGVLVVSDTIKPTSAQAVAELKQLGLRPVLLTGDNERAARAVAAEVGIDEVIAEVLPADKVAVVERLQREGRTVAMVGDGVNDAAALATSDLGIAMGTGTDVAIEASDLTLVRGDLRAAVDAIRLSRRTLRTIKGNLFWAFAYNVAALPLAALGLLNPLIAGAAMAFSSVFVVSNSLRLRRFQAVSTISHLIRTRRTTTRRPAFPAGRQTDDHARTRRRPPRPQERRRRRQRHRGPGGLRSPVGHQQERGRSRPVPAARGPVRGRQPGRADRHRHLRPATAPT